MDLSRTFNLIDISAPVSDSVGGCGPDGCGCGHGGAAEAVPSAEAMIAAAAAPTVVGVTGMTCGHCVSSVTEELSELPGVDGVSVELHADGVSLVTIDASQAVDREAIRAAIAVAGYQLAE